jgi:hypothetical protein
MTHVVTNEELEEFYKFKLQPIQNYEYSLTPKELEILDYNQNFIKGFKGVVLKANKYYSDNEFNILFAKKYNCEDVYKHPGRGGAFGDSLGWASFIYRLSEAHKKPIKVFQFLKKCETIKKEILETSGSIQHINCANNLKINYLDGGTKGGYREVYSTLFLPSKFKWAKNNSRKVAFQFGHRGLRDRQIQDPNDEKLIIDTLRKNNFEPIEVGGFLSNEQCAMLISQAQFFVGTCSGMSHLSHSVGTPVHMLTNNRSLERVSVGHVKNSRSIIPTVFWQHPHHFIDFINNAK